MRQTKSSNPEIIQLIQFLKKESKNKQVGIWLDIAEHLAKPSRQRTTVNLSKINRCTKANEIIVVPGKILASGKLEHSITVAAFNASNKAKEKIVNAKAKYLSIPELVETNPQGSNVKIIG